MENRGKLKAMFIIPSAIGVILFMIPVKNAAGEWTVTVKIIADIIAGAIGGFLPILSVAIVTISAVMTLVALAKPKFIMESPVLNSCFICGPFWIVVRVLGAIFAWITFLELGADKGSGILYAISSADQGGFVLYDLIGTLVIINVIASFLLPLLTDFGLLEYVGALATKLMRPLFKVPGRAAVDCVTSWIGDGTLGVMLTLNQYEGGYYTAKEASIIATLFSAVSITFALVVLDQVGMVQYFGVYYLLICFVGIICALICPLLWPLHKKPETYVIEGKAAPETIPEGYKSSSEYGMDLALKRVSHFPGIGGFLQNGAKNACNMWFGILPTVMCIGTIALICANYTNIFQVHRHALPAPAQAAAGAGCLRCRFHDDHRLYRYVYPVHPDRGRRCVRHDPLHRRGRLRHAGALPLRGRRSDPRLQAAPQHLGAVRDLP